MVLPLLGLVFFPLCLLQNGLAESLQSGFNVQGGLFPCCGGCVQGNASRAEERGAALSAVTGAAPGAASLRAGALCTSLLVGLRIGTEVEGDCPQS